MKRNIIVLVLFLLPFLSVAQNEVKKKAYYFYGEHCPHCQKVDEYFKANGIYDKYEIQKLEVSNPFNQKLFIDFGKAFAQSEWGGVPTIIFGDKYLIGDKPIIDNFEKEINAAENTYEFADPKKIGNAGDEANQGEQGNQRSSVGESIKGNKKIYFLLIILALVLAGGGGLAYINRNKKS